MTRVYGYGTGDKQRQEIVEYGEIKGIEIVADGLFEYNVIKRILKRGDELYITDVSELGSSGIVKGELVYFRERGIKLRVLSIPTTLGEDWERAIGVMIEVYEQSERDDKYRKERQREGIERAKERGVYAGKTKVKINKKKFENTYEIWRVQNKITAVEAQEILKLKPATFYRRVKEYEEAHGLREGKPMQVGR